MDEQEFKDELKDAFTERFDGIETKDGYPNPDYEPEDQYWQDTITELADAAVPVYTNDLYELWMSLGRPEVSDNGLIEGINDIDRIVAIAVYDWALNYLYELAEEYGLN